MSRSCSRGEFSALCSDSRITILPTKAALLSALAVLQVPHPFSDTAVTSSFSCSGWCLPLPTVRAGFTAQIVLISLPSIPSATSSQKGGSGQSNLQWLCPVCTWSSQNYHRQKSVQLSRFIDIHMMNLSFLTSVCFLIWILWIPRICDC